MINKYNQSLEIESQNIDLSTVINSIGDQKTALIVGNQIIATENINIPSNIALDFLPDGKIILSESCSVSIANYLYQGSISPFDLSAIGSSVIFPNLTDDGFKKFDALTGKYDTVKLISSDIPDLSAIYTPIAHKNTEDAINGIVKCNGAGVYSAVVDASSSWNTAYGWGNHASAGYYLGTSSTIRALLSSSATGLTYTDTTGVFTITSGYVIPTTGDISNGNTAYGWGNHSGLYLKLDQGTPQTVASGVPFFSSGIKTIKLYPNADSTSGILFTKSDGTTPIMCVDSSNNRLGIGTLTPNNKIQINGLVNFDTTLHNTFLGDGSGVSVTTGTYNIGVAENSLKNLTEGVFNTALGASTLYSLTKGSYNLASAGYALYSLIDGDYNIAIGTTSQYFNQHASYNTSIGTNSLRNILSSYNTAIAYGCFLGLQTGTSNCGIGINVALTLISGSNNTIIGDGGGYYLSSTSNNNTIVGNSAGQGIAPYIASGNVIIGYKSGFYETGSDKLMIDNAQRASEADARIKALIYGVFAATPVTQIFTINAKTGINIPPTSWLTLPAGSATAGTAPIKLTTGVLLTSPEQGAIEYDGTGIYCTPVNHRRFVSLASDSIIASVETSATIATTLWTGIFNANELKVNRVYLIKGCGLITTHDANDQCTVSITINGTTVVTLISPKGVVTNSDWHFEVFFTIRSVGAVGALSSFGVLDVGSSSVHTLTETAAVNTTIINEIKCVVQWSDTLNSIKLTQCWLQEFD